MKHSPAALFESSITSLPLIQRGKVRDIYDIDDQHMLIVTTDRLSAFDVVMPTPIPGKGRVLTQVANFWFDFFKGLIQRGKVRDIYDVDDHHLLIVTTDRLSAFDVVMPTPIPGKGRVLTEVANFWFDFFKGLIPNHLSEMKLKDVLGKEELEQVNERAIIVRKLKALPVEAIVRGYLIGSGWKDYQQTGAVCGISLRAGLELADQLPHAIYTPSTKAEVGDHDINIDFHQTIDLLGQEHAEQIREVSLEIYTRAAEYALQRGIIIADTKFEFGLDDEDNLVLIDEVLTPDSSRFWPASSYETGISPPSYDKQYVRDYLETLDWWDKTAPGPELPEDVVSNTAEKYQEAQRLLTT